MSHVWDYCKRCGEALDNDWEIEEGFHAVCIELANSKLLTLTKHRKKRSEERDVHKKPFAEQPAWLQMAKLEGRWEPNMEAPLELVIEGPDVDRPTENAFASESSCSGANLLNPSVGIRAGFMLMNMCCHRHIDRGS